MITWLQACESPKTGLSPHHIITPLLTAPPAQAPPDSDVAPPAVLQRLTSSPVAFLAPWPPGSPV